jgi:hypothetical protein
MEKSTTTRKRRFKTQFIEAKAEAEAKGGWAGCPIREEHIYVKFSLGKG